KGFSIIMPTYNQACFFLRAVKSLEHQSFNNWELIIIDDGSTDNTASYISELMNDNNYKIKHIKNEVNMGIGYSINKGLAMSSYEYIAYLPSDDYFFKTHLETLFDVLEKSENTVLAFNGMKYDSNNSLNVTHDF